MKAATIVPQSYLGFVAQQDYHLALAHLIGREDFAHYTQFYTNMHFNEEKYVILDNGLIEGDPRPIGELYDKALRIDAQELVLPDVFVRKDATLAAIDHAMNFLNQKMQNPIKVMAVAQGEDFDSWVDCAKNLLEWGIDCLGIPKVLVKLAGAHGRLAALQEIQEELKETGTEVHLLGCWESPLELKVIENYVRRGEIMPVRGTDSAIAYVYSRAGMRMCDGPRPEGAIDFMANDVKDTELLQYNIQMWQEECAALPPADSKIIRGRF